MLLPLFLEIPFQLLCPALGGVKAALNVVTLIAKRLAKPELCVSLICELLDGFLRVLPGGQTSLAAFSGPESKSSAMSFSFMSQIKITTADCPLPILMTVMSVVPPASAWPL